MRSGKGMRRHETSFGPVEYEDSGGPGPVAVLVHGLLMDEDLWSPAVDRMGDRIRCVVPRLPLGAHVLPNGIAGPRSLEHVASMIIELIRALGLREVTLVGVDTGGAMAQLIAAQCAPEVTRLVLLSCEAYDNYPGGLSGRTLTLMARLPAAVFRLAMQPLRLRVVRRLPVAFGWLTGERDDVTRSWCRRLLRSTAVCSDLVGVLRSTRTDGEAIASASAALSTLDLPCLILWAAADRLMPEEHGRRLARSMPHARFVRVEGTRSLIPLDRPQHFAEALVAFLR